MNYYKVKDGEWIRPKMTGYKMACCDCGLVHVINFEVEKSGRIIFQATRDNRATAAKRRKKKV